MRKEGQLPTKIPLPILLFLCARVPLLLALPFDGLRGYGDLQHFFNVTVIPGLPYIHYWSEFPPLFPFLSELLYELAGGVEHTFTYLLVAVLLAADIGSVILFTRLEKLLYPRNPNQSGGGNSTWRLLVYAVALGGLPYAWWYFDSLAVFFLMLALYLGLRGARSVSLGAVLSLGILTKLFPVLILPALAKVLPPRRTAAIAVVAVGLFVLPVLILYAISPEFTRASLTATGMRSSYATVWALFDGNLTVGGYGPMVHRLDPTMEGIPQRNGPVIPPMLTLAGFGGLGLYVWLRARLETPAQITAFAGLTVALFFIWSPGWSPQWVLFLLPLALLVVPLSPGLLLVVLLVLVNLLEWPLLLSRGLFNTLPLTILLRLFLLGLLGWMFYQETTRSSISHT